MKELTCCFTGHRIIANTDLKDIEKRLCDEIEALIKRGIIYFGSGGALGFDMLAAEAVIKLKSKYDSIRLILVLPCIDQDKYWNALERERYLHIKEKADKIIYTSKLYSAGCMQKRNRHLVKHSRFCIAYIRKKVGGTAYTVKYADKSGLELILI